MSEIFPMIDHPVIDAHMHPYLARHKKDFPFALPESYRELFAEERRAGIGLCCGSFNAPGAGKDPGRLRECNEIVLAVHREYPDEFCPGCNVSPLLPQASCAEIERFFRMGSRWIGEVAWYVMGYDRYDLPGMHEILELAGKLRMTVNLHPSTAEDMDALMTKFPEVNFVIAHPESFGSISDTYELALRHPNMFIDLSGSGLFRRGMLRRGVDMLGRERILFGTDFPVCSAGMNVAGVCFEPLTPEERKAILHDNFLRLTGWRSNSPPAEAE